MDAMKPVNTADSPSSKAQSSKQQDRKPVAKPKPGSPGIKYRLGK